jgi:hypothetical protein
MDRIISKLRMQRIEIPIHAWHHPFVAFRGATFHHEWTDEFVNRFRRHCLWSHSRCSKQMFVTLIKTIVVHVEVVYREALLKKCSLSNFFLTHTLAKFTFSQPPSTSRHVR